MTSFLLIVACILVILCDLFESPNSQLSSRFKTYESFEKNTVDAVYIGTSGVDRFWISGKAFDDYGMTVYPLSVNGLPSWNIINVVKYAYTYQKPKLVIIDTRPFTWDPSTNIDSIPYTKTGRVADQLPLLSPNRIDAINRSVRLMNDIDPTTNHFKIYYYLTFIHYHDMWSAKNFSFDEIGRDESKFLGYRYYAKKSLEINAIKEPVYSDEIGELDKYSTRYLLELINYFKDNNINALFVLSPRQVDESNVCLNNAIFDIIKNEGMNYINFSEKENVEKYKFDYSHDFYDVSHANFYGAVKYTDYFSEYLKENYDLPDHREDEKCAEWNGVYENICQRVKKAVKSNNS